MKSLHKGGWTKYACADYDEFTRQLGLIKANGNYVYRGHRGNWPLIPSVFRSTDVKGQRVDCVEQLRRFKYSLKKSNLEKEVIRARLDEEDYLWALGQHYGLQTPLLDWSLSPYVALFFAFAGDVSQTVGTQKATRTVFALNRVDVTQLSTQLERQGSSETIKFIDKETSDNERAINQSGIFTKTPLGFEMRQWAQNLQNTDGRTLLFEITLPESFRVQVLNDLNLMRINYKTIYPDLSGLCQHINLSLKIPGYNTEL